MNIEKITLLEQIAAKAERRAQERKHHPDWFTAAGDLIPEPDRIAANTATDAAKAGRMENRPPADGSSAQRAGNQPQRRQNGNIDDLITRIDGLISEAETMIS